jgi:hypothetical protein
MRWNIYGRGKMVLDEIRFGAVLLIAGVLTAIITFSGYLVSDAISLGYQFSITEGTTLTLFVAVVFGILLGFGYWLIGYWQETKNIGNPDKTNGQIIKPDNAKIRQKPRNSYVGTEEPRERSLFLDNSRGIKPEMIFKTHSLQEFGIRQFSNNDDWINMRPGRKE